MKAKVKLTDDYSGRSINVVVNLVNYESDKYGFTFESLNRRQRKKIEDFFGHQNAYYSSIEILKVFNH